MFACPGRPPCPFYQINVKHTSLNACQKKSCLSESGLNGLTKKLNFFPQNLSDDGLPVREGLMTLRATDACLW
jgi:hypothetical protein